MIRGVLCEHLIVCLILCNAGKPPRPPSEHEKLEIRLKSGVALSPDFAMLCRAFNRIYLLPKTAAMPPASTASTMFLGLEPDARLSERICTYKRRVHALVGPQTFLDHPPHLTLYLAAFANGAAVADAVALVVRELHAIRTSILGWHTFWSDQLTGRHTLVCQLDDEAVDELREIQHSTIAALAPLRHAKVTAARYASRLASLSPREQTSIASSGFPYTGEHWHPHLTIASINAADWPAIEREVLPNPPAIDGCFPALALYRLVDEHPIMLRRFPLTHSDAASNCKLRLAS